MNRILKGLVVLSLVGLGGFGIGEFLQTLHVLIAGILALFGVVVPVYIVVGVVLVISAVVVWLFGDIKGEK